MATTTKSFSKSQSWLNYRTIWRWHFYAGLICIPFVLGLRPPGRSISFANRLKPGSTNHMSICNSPDRARAEKHRYRPRQELVNRIIANVAGTLPAAKVAFPDPEDNIGPPQELPRFVRGELDDIYRNKGGGASERSLDFAGDDSRYRLVFRMFR